MPKLVLSSQQEADHLARLLKAAGYTPQVEASAKNVTVSSAAPSKAWRAVVLKFNKQRQIQAAAGAMERRLRQEELV